MRLLVLLGCLLTPPALALRQLQRLPSDEFLRRWLLPKDACNQTRIMKDLLPPLMVPRPSGSEAIVTVRTYLVDFFRKLNYKVELDEFTDQDTPVGKMSFSNLIFTRFPKARRYLTLTAQYGKGDSLTAVMTSCTLLYFTPPLQLRLKEKARGIRWGYGFRSSHFHSNGSRTAV